MTTNRILTLKPTKAYSCFSICQRILAPLVAFIPDDVILDAEAGAAENAGFCVLRFPVIHRSATTLTLEHCIIRPTTLPCRAIHRGFMLTDSSYTLLWTYLKTQYDIDLVVSPLQYSTAHYFPNYYQHIRNFSPRAVWCPCPNDDVITTNVFKEAIATVRSWGCSHVMLKDFVKSAKDVSSAFTKASTESADELAELACLLVQSRGSKFNKGVVFKEFYELKRYIVQGQEVYNEWRCFFGPNGKLLSTDMNSNQNEQRDLERVGVADSYLVTYDHVHVSLPSPDILEFITEAACRIGSPYMTIDIAERQDGTWFVLEAGDGGVSGPPTGQDIQIHWRHLADSFSYYLVSPTL